tara:strand:- start:1662 stop:1913 length:252 start_codon:yes stop_codon:yes gene_type:complete
MIQETHSARVTYPIDNKSQWTDMVVKTRFTFDNISQIIKSPYSSINKKRLINAELKQLNWELKSCANGGENMFDQSSDYKGAK